MSQMIIKGNSLTLAKGHPEFKIKTYVFSETIESFETKVHMKAYGRIGMNIDTNELGHKTKMATMPKYK